MFTKSLRFLLRSGKASSLHSHRRYVCVIYGFLLYAFFSSDLCDPSSIEKSLRTIYLLSITAIYKPWMCVIWFIYEKQSQLLTYFTFYVFFFLELYPNVLLGFGEMEKGVYFAMHLCTWHNYSKRYDNMVYIPSLFPAWFPKYKQTQTHIGADTNHFWCN